MAARRGALILAAGASVRMGQPKALLPWGRTTLIEYAVTQARVAEVTELVVVLGPTLSHLQLGARSVVNPDPDTGRSASIRLGAAALPDDVSAILVQSVDQPAPSDVLTALFRTIGERVEIAIPTYQGRRGHPIVVTGRILPELRAVTEERQGLRAVTRAHHTHVHEVPVDHPGVLWNLNDPAAFAAAKADAQA